MTAGSFISQRPVLSPRLTQLHEAIWDGWRFPGTSGLWHIKGTQHRLSDPAGYDYYYYWCTIVANNDVMFSICAALFKHITTYMKSFNSHNPKGKTVSSPFY